MRKALKSQAQAPLSGVSFLNPRMEAATALRLRFAPLHCNPPEVC